MKIVILDKDTIAPGDASIAVLQKYGEITTYDSTPDHLVADRIGDAQIVLTDQTPITKQTIETCTNLQLISVIATGYDRIDLQSAAQKGIPVCNAPAYAAETVAQQTILLMLACCNHLIPYQNSVAAGHWGDPSVFSFEKHPIFELNGKTVGLIGLGNIARHVLPILLAFGANILIYTRYKDRKLESERVQFADLNSLLKKSDLISLHTPLTAQNQHLINTETIAKMKDGVILINTARGGLIDETALADALKSGKVKAAGLDVLTEEPPTKDCPLLGLQNCIITPHIGYHSNEARKRLMDITIQNIEGFRNHSLINCVNQISS